MRTTFVSIELKNGNFLINHSRKFETEYFLRNNFIEVLSDSRVINSHIKCDLNSCACRINSFVWVSKKRKAIWFENPKAGSRSLVHALGLTNPHVNEAIRKLLSKRDESGITIHYNQHQSSEINKLAYKLKLYNLFRLNFFSSSDFNLELVSPDVSIEMYSGFFSFAVIRNPFEKMISNYKMFTTVEDRIIKLKQTFNLKDISNLSFKEFVRLTGKFQNHHWAEQINFLPKNIDRVDLIACIEDLSENWTNLCNRLSIKAELLKLNVTNNNGVNYQEYYDRETFEFVRQHYARDIELFNRLKNEDISNNLGRQLS